MRSHVLHRRGFTLIELMIVIAIIAVIAAIAIPNLLNASIAGNETAAASNLRQLAGAQGTFRRNDWYDVGSHSYAAGANQLSCDSFRSWRIACEIHSNACGKKGSIRSAHGPYTGELSA